MSSNEENAPLWLSEGLAELYSTFQVDGDEVHIGRPVSSHVFWLRKNSLIPLRELLAIDRKSPVYNEGNKRGVFYAQPWALTHMLMLGQSARRQQATQ